MSRVTKRKLRRLVIHQTRIHSSEQLGYLKYATLEFREVIFQEVCLPCLCSEMYLEDLAALLSAVYSNSLFQKAAVKLSDFALDRVIGEASFQSSVLSASPGSCCIAPSRRADEHIESGDGEFLDISQTHRPNKQYYEL
ncbi:hypothetical protein ACET3Z_018597 [Daucus carota]